MSASPSLSERKREIWRGGVNGDSEQYLKFIFDFIIFSLLVLVDRILIDSKVTYFLNANIKTNTLRLILHHILVQEHVMTYANASQGHLIPGWD